MVYCNRRRGRWTNRSKALIFYFPKCVMAWGRRTLGSTSGRGNCFIVKTKAFNNAHKAACCAALARKHSRYFGQRSPSFISPLPRSQKSFAMFRASLKRWSALDTAPKAACCAALARNSSRSLRSQSRLLRSACQEKLAIPRRKERSLIPLAKTARVLRGKIVHSFLLENESERMPSWEAGREILSC